MGVNVLVLAFLMAFFSYTDGVCFTCPYRFINERCTDPFHSPVPEQEICFFNKQINDELCKKYSGGYQIRCQVRGSALACERYGSNLCPSSEFHHVTFSLTLTLSLILFTKIMTIYHP